MQNGCLSFLTAFGSRFSFGRWLFYEGSAALETCFGGCSCPLGVHLEMPYARRGTYSCDEARSGFCVLVTKLKIKYELVTLLMHVGAPL
jgi:hypothetical protein